MLCHQFGASAEMYFVVGMLVSWRASSGFSYWWIRVPGGVDASLVVASITDVPAMFKDVYYNDLAGNPTTVIVYLHCKMIGEIFLSLLTFLLGSASAFQKWRFLGRENGLVGRL